ncbi:Ribosomal RNA small subunit methyltransferase H [Galdieria sulphuraria]|nr:Ribosomal RNA small subunit methyltransferase H [Galdieria sulphuraria]
MTFQLSFFWLSSLLCLHRRKAFHCVKRKTFHSLKCYCSVEDKVSPTLQFSRGKERNLHVPVLLQEVIENAVQANVAGKVFVDCTVGAGGHCQKIMELGIFSRCIAIDKDENCRKFLEESNLTHSVRFVQGSFAKIVEILTQEKVTSQDVGFILADLGVSSMQLDNASRGFSFSHDGPLDMRMDLSQSTTAWRRTNPINTTCQLANIVCNAKKERARYRKIHPATLTFQSLRLFVNSELNELNTFIPMALSCLGPVGRLAIISFHSLEDRIVKQTFKEYAEKSEFRILTKKPIVPSEEEREVNIRCRSAKMRVIERYPKGNERDFTQH